MSGDPTFFELIYPESVSRDILDVFDRAEAEGGMAFARRLAERLEAGFDALRRFPAFQAEPSEPPLPAGMLYRFACDDEETGRRLLVTVLFRYRADEMTLDIVTAGFDWLHLP